MVDGLATAYLGDRSMLPIVTRDDPAAQLAEGSVAIWDVRPDPELRAGHIPGALSVPMTELGRQVRRPPVDRLVVAYCRGPYCGVRADKAVRRLGARGVRAARLADGFPEWRLAGLPVETSAA